MRPISLCQFAALALLFGVSVSPAGAEDQPLPELRPGQVVTDFYALTEADERHEKACQKILASLNRPKVYNPGQLWDLLLGTTFNYIWQEDTNRDYWGYPLTVGEIAPNRSRSPDFLALDVNHDGHIDYLYRWMLQMESQDFSSIFVRSQKLGPGAVHVREMEKIDRNIRIEDVKPLPPLDINPGLVAGDFYLIDILNVDQTSYFLAATSVFPEDDDLHQVKSFVLTVGPDFSLNVACMLTSNAKI